MTMLTAAQRQILEDIASGKTTEWQESPDVFGDHQMLYEAGLIDGANASADDGFGLLQMRLTFAGQQSLGPSPIRFKGIPEGLSVGAFSPVGVPTPSEEVCVPVVRPLWKRWGFWKAIFGGFGSVGGCILFVIGVWTFYVEILMK